MFLEMCLPVALLDDPKKSYGAKRDDNEVHFFITICIIIINAAAVVVCDVYATITNSHLIIIADDVEMVDINMGKRENAREMIREKRT